NLFQLRVANLGLHAIALIVNLDPNSRARQARPDLVRELKLVVRDWDDHGRTRREPGWERARVVLDQPADEAFHRTKQRPVNHSCPMPLAVLADVIDVASLGQVEIDLNRRSRPFPAKGIDPLDVDLRTVKCATALIDIVVE